MDRIEYNLMPYEARDEIVNRLLIKIVLFEAVIGIIIVFSSIALQSLDVSLLEDAQNARIISWGVTAQTSTLERAEQQRLAQHLDQVSQHQSSKISAELLATLPVEARLTSLAVDVKNMAFELAGSAPSVAGLRIMRNRIESSPAYSVDDLNMSTDETGEKTVLFTLKGRLR